MPPAWLLALPLALFAQEAQTPVFQTESSLALVRFQVERKHTFADNLKPEDVILLEDGQARKFTVFEGARRRSSRRSTSGVLSATWARAASRAEP
jgi:hypothetical protein